MGIRVLQRLHSAEELAEYAHCYARASGYHVPVGYLRRSTVFGYRRGGRLVGGVVMSTSAPFRTIERIPEPHRSGVVARLDPEGTVELTCVWLDRSVRGGTASALFWFGLFLESGRRGVRTVMFGTESERLYQLYRCGRPTLLYHGPVVVDGREQIGWVFLSPVAHRWPALARMTLYKALRDWRHKATQHAGDPVAVPSGRLP